MMLATPARTEWTDRGAVILRRAIAGFDTGKKKERASRWLKPSKRRCAVVVRYALRATLNRPPRLRR